MTTQPLGVTTNKGIFVVLIVVGAVLLALGVSASESISSDFSRLFTGQPTDKAVWLLIGGAVATLSGLAGLLRSSK